MRVLVHTRTEIDRGGAFIPVDVTGVVQYKVDRSYGEDADGNRGESRTIVEDVFDVFAWDDDTHQLELKPQEEEALAEKLTHRFLGDYNEK